MRTARKRRTAEADLPPGIALDEEPPWTGEAGAAWSDYLERTRPDLDPLALLVEHPARTVRQILAIPRENRSDVASPLP
jgi:hypothetical protein